MNYTEELLRSSFIEDCRQTLPRHRGKEWTVRPPSKLRGMVLHQSLEEVGSAYNVALYHVGPNHISASGLPSMSYTLFIDKDGRVILANNVEHKTWSQGYVDPDHVDENALYVGVCVGGNFSGPGYYGTEAPLMRQMDAVDRLWKLCRGLWDWDGNSLFGHYHFGKPACPGHQLLEYISSHRLARFSSILEKQAALMRLGLGVQVDGVWGPQSKSALIEFQKTSGLLADGVWGPRTTAAVLAALGAQ